MGSPYSERDFHGPTELNTIDKEEDTRDFGEGRPALDAA